LYLGDIMIKNIEKQVSRGKILGNIDKQVYPDYAKKVLTNSQLTRRNIIDKEDYLMHR